MKKLTQIVQNGKTAVVAVGVAVASTSAQAGILAADVAVDTGDITYIFGGLVTFGVLWYGIKKAKSLLGA